MLSVHCSWSQGVLYRRGCCCLLIQDEREGLCNKWQYYVWRTQSRVWRDWTIHYAYVPFVCLLRLTLQIAFTLKLKAVLSRNVFYNISFSVCKTCICFAPMENRLLFFCLLMLELWPGTILLMHLGGKMVPKLVCTEKGAPKLYWINTLVSCCKMLCSSESHQLCHSEESGVFVIAPGEWISYTSFRPYTYVKLIYSAESWPITPFIYTDVR